MQLYASGVVVAVLAYFHLLRADHPAFALSVEEVVDVEVHGEFVVEETFVGRDVDGALWPILLSTAVVGTYNVALQREPERLVDDEAVLQVQS